MKFISTNTPSATVQVFAVFEKDLEALQNKVDFRVPSPKTFDGSKDSLHWLENSGQQIALLGLGDGKNPKVIHNSFRRILSKNDKKIDDVLAIQFIGELNEFQLTQALVGFKLGAYHADFYKKERKNGFKELSVLVNVSETIISKASKTADAMQEAMRLVDLPPSVKTPEYLAQWALTRSKELGFKSQIIDEKQAKKEGLEAFLAVGQGSSKASKFIIMEYRPSNPKFHLGLVGKGVTFDTGGLNIKTQGMHHMKSDMGGAAAVMGTMQLIADLGLPCHLTAIVPAVENAVSAEAFLPSEVISSHAGLSIEVIDTDAEGRLILADGLSYLVKNHNPDHVIDLATLTGSSVGTFGYECGALFSNDEDLSLNLQTAGNSCSERLWPLPVWEEYGKEMDSDIADIKNYHGKPIAGAITAAKFLQAFTHEHPSWAHLDIAGVAFGDSEFSKSKTGTAFGVQLLLNFIENQLNHVD